MPFYHKVGRVPRLKHTTFYKSDGVSLHREELVSSKGFSDIYSNKYHLHMPTAVKRVKELDPLPDTTWPEAPVLYYHFFTEEKKVTGDFITARQVFLENSQCIISTGTPSKDTNCFFRNAYHAEYIFVHHGRGKLVSDYGVIGFEDGDQLIIPRSTTYQLKFNDYDKVKLLIVESDTAYEIPQHFRNQYGQLDEAAPYSERDFKLPADAGANDEKGDFRLIIKAGRRLFEHIVPHHPFDVVGWDGYLYPYAFNIRNYNPKVGRLHLPPPIHLAFNTQHFVVCNFVPRPYDFHPDAIPAPYFHANIDSDEVLYYVEGDFMSRKGIKEGSVTLHPCGMPHGPQPGKTEASVGKAGTNEYAVMIDTFAPLRPTINVRDTLDKDYARSWLENGQK